MKKLQFTILIILVISISGCTNNTELSTAQINKIKTISVQKPKFSESLKLEIAGSIKTSEIQNTIAPTGQLELSIIGRLIDNHIHSKKQNKFEKKYKNKLSKIREFKVQNIDKKIQSIMLSTLKKDTLLNTKVVDNSSTYFDSEINLFGLEIRDTDQNDEVHLSAKIALKVFLIGKGGKPLLADANLITYSKDSYSVTELSNDNTLVGKLFEQAYDNFETLFTVHLNRVFKNKDLHPNS